MTRPTIIMAAPNGARKTHKDHPNLPVSMAETVDEAALCFKAGATVLHAHVRGKQEEHVLDVGLYQELIAEMKQQVPDMIIQITTEAVGIYTPEQQVACVQSVVPEMASVSLKEMTSNYSNSEFAKNFYAWANEAGVHIQHILYSAEDFEHFLRLKKDGTIPESQRCVLFVLGRYSVDFQSTPADLKPFLEYDLDQLDWFVCAFGINEQACASAAIDHGGHSRIGFENNLHLHNGNKAKNSAELVSNLFELTNCKDKIIATSNQTRQILGMQ